MKNNTRHILIALVITPGGSYAAVGFGYCIEKETNQEQHKRDILDALNNGWIGEENLTNKQYYWLETDIEIPKEVKQIKTNITKIPITN